MKLYSDQKYLRAFLIANCSKMTHRRVMPVATTTAVPMNLVIFTCLLFSNCIGTIAYIVTFSFIWHLV